MRVWDAWDGRPHRMICWVVNEVVDLQGLWVEGEANSPVNVGWCSGGKERFL